MIGLVDRIKKTAPVPGMHRAVKRTDCPNKPICGNSANKPPDPAQNIPAPEPASLGAEYADLWHRAWTLADWIDDPNGAPLADRKAKLPELDKMRARMATIERQAGPDPEASPPGTWHPWESGTTTRGRTPENCPAMCRRSGKCYSKAYFEAKPGRAAECNPADCKYISNERGNDERKTT